MEQVKQPSCLARRVSSFGAICTRQKSLTRVDCMMEIDKSRGCKSNSVVRFS